jgi:hypothetical protein
MGPEPLQLFSNKGFGWTFLGSNVGPTWVQDWSKHGSKIGSGVPIAWVHPAKSAFRRDPTPQ